MATTLTFSTRRPTTESPLAKLAITGSGRYPISRAKAWTRSHVPREALRSLRRASEAVAKETPAAAARSRSVIRAGI